MAPTGRRALVVVLARQIVTASVPRTPNRVRTANELSNRAALWRTTPLSAEGPVPGARTVTRQDGATLGLGRRCSGTRRGTVAPPQMGARAWFASGASTRGSPPGSPLGRMHCVSVASRSTNSQARTPTSAGSHQRTYTATPTRINSIDDVRADEEPNSAAIVDVSTRGVPCQYPRLPGAARGPGPRPPGCSRRCSRPRRCPAAARPTA
jgi:hypothetical protein